MNAKRFIAAGQGIVLHPVSKRPLTTERVEQVGFGVIGEYLDLTATGEDYAFRLLLAAPELLEACKAMLRTHAPTINGLCKICHHYGDDCEAHAVRALVERLTVTFPPAVDPLASMEE
jgi:hypothetical protein